MCWKRRLLNINLNIIINITTNNFNVFQNNSCINIHLKMHTLTNSMQWSFVRAVYGTNFNPPPPCPLTICHKIWSHKNSWNRGGSPTFVIFISLGGRKTNWQQFRRVKINSNTLPWRFLIRIFIWIMWCTCNRVKESWSMVFTGCFLGCGETGGGIDTWHFYTYWIVLTDYSNICCWILFKSIYTLKELWRLSGQAIEFQRCY